MGREKVMFKSEERQDLTKVASFLRELADKLETGKLTLLQGKQELTLTIPASVVLELKVEEEVSKSKTKESLEIEIEWVKGDQTPGGVKLA